ncbi:MAG TPA: tetratricopeptide repeat protein [bacterium]|nr:tetratricopeptide repeat protein [bacterium]
MADLPTGTVTFLFTDIEGSTRLWEAHPDQMKGAVARHDTLLREAVEAHSGHIFKTVGDAVDAVFVRATDAVAAAVAAQRALTAEPWLVPGGLRVRMALSTGVADEREGDYFGPPLNRAARLMRAAHGGQILLLPSTHELVRDALLEGVRVRDLGEHRLRDLARPEHIYQVIGIGLPGEFPPLRTLARIPNNLPVQLTSFIGRSRELAEVRRLLGVTRLLTLTGAGGAGKTRLALQAAAEIMDDYSDGVWLVELASLSDPALVLPTIASTLGVRETIAQTLTDALADYLRTQTALIVLDNCEHLSAACAEVAETLLRKCPNLRVLATSQEVLGVPGEVAYAVPSLSLPDPDRVVGGEDITQFEAVRLFIDRAALSKPDFHMTAGTAPLVAQVVRRLDGIPLAIELAAARTKVMSVEQIASKLDDRFRLLTTGGRTTPPRHQTLKAAMDWSYELLTEHERMLLRRLSVFAGGWTLEAAEAVSAADGLEVEEVLDLLSRLVDRSLVLVQEPNGETRYRLLETVRQYARDRLAETGEAEQVRARHRDWFLHLAEQGEALLQGAQQAVWFDRLEVEHDNLRAALEWCRRETEDPELGRRLSGALWRFWRVRGYWTEGRGWLEAAIARGVDVHTEARAKALIGAAYLTFFQGDFERAAALAAESLGLSRELGDKRGTASCLNILGIDACRLERFDRAAALSEESLAISRETGDQFGVLDARAVQSFVARAQGDAARAAELLGEIVVQARTLGDRWVLVEALNNLGLIRREQGDYARATALLEETLVLAQELKDKAGTAFAQSNLGIVAWYQGDFERASDFFKESLTLRMELGDKRGIATSLVGLATVATGREEFERAAVLFAAADALRLSIGVPLPPFIRAKYEELLEGTRSALGEDAFTRAWAQGQALTPEQVAALEGSAPT